MVLIPEPTQQGMICCDAETPRKVVSEETEPYYFETYVGYQKNIEISRGDSLFWISSDLRTAYLTRGPQHIESHFFATLVRGFAPENKSSTITNRTVLPYINGCSTKQIFPPDRPGDPTMQMLFIPPHCSEQHHHIHSTARSVFVLSGSGRCIVGLNEKSSVTVDLVPKRICVLSPMCPHHFETSDEPLIVLPVHVWSSVLGAENGHPMLNGTFRI